MYYLSPAHTIEPASAREGRRLLVSLVTTGMTVPYRGDELLDGGTYRMKDPRAVKLIFMYGAIRQAHSVSELRRAWGPQEGGGLRLRLRR